MLFTKVIFPFAYNFSFAGKNRCSIEIGKEIKMDKKIKFSDQPRRVKIIYAAVIGVLCITAVVVGIFSAASRNNEPPEDDPTVNQPPVDDGNNDGDGGNENENGNQPEGEGDKKPDKLTMVSPVVGEVTKHHSIDTPVFSTTLNEWRVHTGIDISTEESAEVFAAADGTVSRVYNDARFGKTVEITHDGGIVSVYSNLASTDIAVKEGDEVKSGALIGLVGDTSLSELAEEPHLHFGVKVEGVSVNPLDYISEESKQASLGITEV